MALPKVTTGPCDVSFIRFHLGSKIILHVCIFQNVNSSVNQRSSLKLYKKSFMCVSILSADCICVAHACNAQGQKEIRSSEADVALEVGFGHYVGATSLIRVL